MSSFKPIRAAVLTSHAAPGIGHVLAHESRGALFDIAAVISSENYLAEGAEVQAAGVPLLHRPLRRFCSERGASLRNTAVRAEYDIATAETLRELNVDYVLLYGYRYLVTQPLLSAFPQRVLALYDGDLALRDAESARIFGGPHPVRDALQGGHAETRCSVFMVTERVAAGPLFLLSAPYPAAGVAADARAWHANGLLLDYADVHRRWMVSSAWPQMMIKTMELLAAGRIQVVGDVVWIDGVPGPCRLGEAPSACRSKSARIDAGIPASCPFIER